MDDVQSLFAASVAALGKPEALTAVQTISALADCTAPRGTYLTEIHSGRGGQVCFKQTWANRTPIAVVINSEGAWATDTAIGETESIDATEVSMIRGHEFQILPLTLSERFTETRRDGESQWNGTNCFVVRALDDLKLPCTLYFRAGDSRWAGMQLTNARRPDESVRVVVNTWVQVDDILLPARITATDTSGAYVFDFRSISINTADETLFSTPRAVAAQAKSHS